MGPVILIIRDGWGFAESGLDAVAEGNAIRLAHTPVNDRLLEECSWNLLDCSGEEVGLPVGQMGNSEVGHLNLGAGRIVYQDVTRIFKAIRSGEFSTNPAFSDLFDQIKQSEGRLHLVGLCSDGGVHSHIDHLHALLDLCSDSGLPVVLHCITDGRDTSPTRGREFIAGLQRHLAQLHDGRIGTISGRYFAMDRDKRWERIEKAYRAIVFGVGEAADDPVVAVQRSYDSGVTDEFFQPTVIAHGLGHQGLQSKDGIIFFNFRADRARQLTTALIAQDFPHFERVPLPSTHLVTMTQYEDTPTNPVAFTPHRLTDILTDALSASGLTQLRIAETEKYAHVTYFFNGGREAPCPGEERRMIPSPKVATYDLRPEMSALEVTSELIRLFEANRYSFVLVNYANPDMVGHTADIPATIKAVETVDQCVGEVLASAKRLGATALVTSDHGNAERLRDAEGNPFTAHTVNPVQFIWVPPGPSAGRVRRGILGDVAPTVLQLLGLKKPLEMTGDCLIDFS